MGDRHNRHNRHDDKDRPSVARPTWKDGIVLVCSECDGAKGLDPKQARQALKYEAKKTLGRRSVVVVESGCLDICPKREVAVAAVGADGRWDRAVTVRSVAACSRFIAELGVERSVAGGTRPPVDRPARATDGPS